MPLSTKLKSYRGGQFYWSQAAALITHVLEYVLPLLPQTGMYIIGHALRQFGSATKPTADIHSNIYVMDTDACEYILPYTFQHMCNGYRRL
jgi:hypothetical protein